MYMSCACTYNNITCKLASYVLTGLQVKLVTEGASLSLLVLEFNICCGERLGVLILPSVRRGLLQVPQHFC